MTLITWDRVYETSISSLDDQHKQLISLLNRIFEALTQNKGKEEIEFVITNMEKFAEFHFSSEEKFMADAGYPELDEHRIFHETFIAKVDDYHRRFDASEWTHDETLSAEVTLFLTNWVNEHLAVIDHQYIPYLQKAGLS